MGDPAPIDAALAKDGVDEYLDMHLPRRMDASETSPPAGSLHLHRTDGEGEWMLRAVDGSLLVTSEHGKGDAAVRGSSHDLVLYLWNRARGETIEVFGDESVATAWSVFGN